MRPTRRFRPWCFVLLACFLPARSGAEERPITGDAVPAYRPVDEAVLRHMDAIGCRAATVAIARDGKLLYSRGYGWADADRRRPTPPDALLRIASCSKPLTAAEVAKLIRDREVSPDTRVFGLLPLKPYNGKEGDPRLADITVQHLREHKGGWDRQKSFDPVFRTRDIEKALGLKKPATPANVVQYMLAQPLQFDPGSRSAYSNFGYCVLGRVVEHVTGRPYAEAVRRDLLEPLGIRDILPGRSAAGDRDPREVSYPLADDALSVEAMDASGGWVASAPALCRFLEAYWIGGEPRSRGVQEDWMSFGDMPGTSSLIRQRADGINYAVLLNKEGDAEALRKALDAAIDRIVREVRYAAVWEKRSGPAWVARHDLSPEDFQKAIDKLTADGYRPTWISGNGVGGQARYAAIWEKRGGPAWSVRYGLSEEEYQKESIKRAADGDRLTVLNGYDVGGQVRYAAVWERRVAPIWASRFGLTADGYQKAFDKYFDEDYRLTSVSGCAEGGQARFAAIWEKREGPAWVARHALTAAEYQKEFDKQAAAGYRLAFLNGYDVGGRALFAAIWEKRDGPAQVARHALTAAEYQKEYDRLAAAGYRPLWVSCYSVVGGP